MPVLGKINWALMELKCQAQTLARAVGVPVGWRSRRLAFGRLTGNFQLVPVHAENVYKLFFGFKVSYHRVNVKCEHWVDMRNWEQYF